MECLLPYLCMVTVPLIMVGLERMLDYRGVGLGRFHCSDIKVIALCGCTSKGADVKSINLHSGPTYYPVTLAS